MKWQLTEPHHIDEQVLPAGTIIGDETQWPYRSSYNDPKIKRKIGDPLPPSRAMTPMDDEAHRAFEAAFGEGVEPQDPSKSVPLTGAQGAPKVHGPGVKPEPLKSGPVNPAPSDDVPKTGLNAPNPAGHDSAKNPGDSKDTQTARTPDISKKT